MNDLLRVSEHDITPLANHQFRPLLNQLLIAEAKRYGISPASIEITDEDNTPDGGVDVRIEHSVAVPEACRIPVGLSVWQYKAGKASPSDIKLESQKTGVQEAITKNGYYYFVVGQSCTDSMRRTREQALDSVFNSAGKPPKRNLFTAAEIAEWVSDYPVIAAQLLKLRLPDEFYTFQQWDELPQTGTRIKFQYTDSRQTIINSIVDLLKSRSQPTCIRVVGSDGTGKTRLILEAIRATEVENLTFYAVTPDAVPDDFLSFIQARSSIDRLVLVVDECNDSDFRTLWNRTQRCNGRVVLITVGAEELERTGELEPDIFFFLLDKLDDNAIQRVIYAAAPALHPELHWYIARAVEGYVKFATAIAESLSINQGINSTSELMTLPYVKFILRSLVKNDEERDAMYALSVLRFVGLDGDVSAEGQALAQFLGLDFGKLKRIASQLGRKGLVIKRGRFRYVTPSLLAVWFARELWEVQGNEIISTLMPRLPSESARQRLLQRLGDIGEEKFAIPIVEEYFGSQSELATIDALDDEDISKLFSILVNAAPVACTQTLERIFRGVPHQRLLEFRKGRRQLIFTLERLLRRKETFYQAARILLKLAAAENETWGNNATGVWKEIFFIHLGLGPFPAWERHLLIQEAISTSNSIEMRILGVKALFSSLTQAQFGTYGEGPGGHFPEQWHPQIWGDVWRTYQSALELLDQLQIDADERVMQEAISTFIGTLRVFFKTPLKDELLNRLKILVYNPYLEPHKKKLIDVLDQVLEYDIKVLSDDEIETLRQWREDLVGNSYHDRLRRWVGELNWADRHQVNREQENPVNLKQILIDLAKEGHQNPELLRNELGWLTSSEAQMSAHIAFELGVLDSERFWLSELIPLLPPASYFISYYLHGHWGHGRQDWVITLLAEWVESHPELSATSLRTIHNIGGSDQQAQWVISLIKKGWLQPEHLGRLWMYGWLEPLSEEVFKELLESFTLKDELKHTSIALDLITKWIESHPNHSPVTAQFIVSLLKRVPYDRVTYNSDMGWDNWQKISMFYLKAFMVEVVEATIHQFFNWASTPIGRDERIFVLTEALKISPEVAWPLIGKALLDTQNKYYWPSTSFDLAGQDRLDTDTLLGTVEQPLLMRWLEENKPLAPQIVAKYILVEQEPLPTLARELIINYGSDEIVRSRLHPQAKSIMWGRSYSERLKNMLDVVRSWFNDENEIVRNWANEIAEDIEEAIRKEKPRDDEDDLFWR